MPSFSPPLEIEQKFRLASPADFENLTVKLAKLDARTLSREKHCDTYYRHPARDFGESGEAFRIRELNDDAYVTYKGKRSASPVKTRPELEILLAQGSSRSWKEMLLLLGFAPLQEVYKTRLPHMVDFDGHSVCVVFDEVENIGNFVEIEAIAEDSSQVESLQSTVQRLAQYLELKNLETKSYLRLILEKDRSTHP